MSTNKEVFSICPQSILQVFLTSIFASTNMDMLGYTLLVLFPSVEPARSEIFGYGSKYVLCLLLGLQGFSEFMPASHNVVAHHWCVFQRAEKIAIFMDSWILLFLYNC